jgi:hypothetical protein
MSSLISCWSLELTVEYRISDLFSCTYLLICCRFLLWFASHGFESPDGHGMDERIQEPRNEWLWMKHSVMLEFSCFCSMWLFNGVCKNALFQAWLPRGSNWRLRNWSQESILALNLNKISSLWQSGQNYQNVWLIVYEMRLKVSFLHMFYCTWDICLVSKTRLRPCHCWKCDWMIKYIKCLMFFKV